MAQAASSAASWSAGPVGPAAPSTAVRRASTTAVPCGQLVDDDLGAGERVEEEVAGGEGGAVGEDLQPPRGRLRVEVGDADEEAALHAAGTGLHGQRDDGLVAPLAPHGQDPDGHREAHLRDVAGRVVGDDEDLRAAGPSGQRAGQLEGVAQVARRVAEPDALDGLGGPAAVGHLVGHHARRLPGGDDAHPAVGREPGQRLDGGALGRAQAVGEDVRGAHARRGVHDQHEVPCQPRRPLQEGARRGEDQDRHEEQLEEKEQRATQALPRRVGLQVAHELLPEVGAADRPLRAPQTQQVEGDDERDEGQPDQRQRRQERHRRTSGHHAPPPQLGEDEVGQGQGRGHRHVGDAPLRRHRVEPGLPGGQSGPVGVHRREVGGDVHAGARSRYRRGAGRPRAADPARRG